jgi:hypothetical protein
MASEGSPMQTLINWITTNTAIQAEYGANIMQGKVITSKDFIDYCPVLNLSRQPFGKSMWNQLGWFLVRVEAVEKTDMTEAQRKYQVVFDQCEKAQIKGSSYSLGVHEHEAPGDFVGDDNKMPFVMAVWKINWVKRS